MTQTSIPSNILTGRFIGRFVVGVVDGVDSDDEPDYIPATGTVTFTPTPPYLPSPTSSEGALTILQTPSIAILDDEGYLCTPDQEYPGSPGRQGIRLIAGNSPHLLVEDWTYTVSYSFGMVNGTTPSIPSHSVMLLSGETVDLTGVIAVPSSPGVGIAQAEALLAQAKAVAQSVRDDADAGKFRGSPGPASTVPGPLGKTPVITIGKVDVGMPVPGSAPPTMLPQGTNLDLLVDPGDYQFNALTLTGSGLPVELTQGYGFVRITRTDLGRRTLQEIHPTATAQGAKVVYRRLSTTAVVSWSPWRAFTSTRTSETAGRAIYQWDEINSREQLIHGDTGIRKFTVDAAGVHSTNFYIRRIGYSVQISGDFNNQGAVGDKALATLAPGFRSTSYARLGLAMSVDGSTNRLVSMGQNGADLRILNMPEGFLYTSVTYMPTDPWPTTLPGTTIGTIPNL